MKHSLRSALAAAHAAFVPPSPVQVQPVRLPLRETADRAVRRRLAGETAINVAPISIAIPEEDTAQTISRFVDAQFDEAQRLRRKRKRAA